MNDVGKLYQEYDKIKKIIASAHGIDGYEPEVAKWIEDHYKKTFNGYKNVYIPIANIRTICQKWIDRIIFENEINRFGKGWMDLMCFFCKGKYKERKRFMQMFYTIYYDMVDRLDALDGGPDADNKIRSTGFVNNWK